MDQKKQKTILQRLISLPFALVFVAAILPLMTFSCGEHKLAEVNAYQLATGGSFESVAIEELQKNTEKADMEKMPSFPSVPLIYVIFVAVALAIAFAFISPVGSAILGSIALCFLWLLLHRIPVALGNANYPMDAFECQIGMGTYCISLLLLMGITLSVASIIRERRGKHS